MLAGRNAISRRRRGEELAGDAGALVEDGKRPIEALVNLDPRFRVAVAMWPGQELDVMRGEDDRVVVADDPLVFEAEDGLGVEPTRPGAIGWCGIRGGLGKARIVAREKGPQEGIRPGAVVDAGEAQLRAQTILEGPKESLDATLGLRTAGGNPADAQLLQGAFDLSGRGFSGQLLGEGRGTSGSSVEDAVAIAVDGDRDAVGLHELPQDHKVPLGILLVPKGGGEDVAGGVVEGREEGQAWAPMLQPIMITAVELHEQAGLRHALTVPTVLGRTSSARTPHPGGPEDAVDGGLREREVFAFGQQLAEVCVIDAGVGGLSEPDDPSTDGIRHAPGRWATAVPMDQRLRAVPADRSAQAPDLTSRETQKVGRCGHQKLAAVEGTEYDELLLRAVRQGDHPPRIRVGEGRTFSLNS